MTRKQGALQRHEVVRRTRLYGNNHMSERSTDEKEPVALAGTVQHTQYCER